MMTKLKYLVECLYLMKNKSFQNLLQMLQSVSYLKRPNNIRMQSGLSQVDKGIVFNVSFWCFFEIVQFFAQGPLIFVVKVQYYSQQNS